jgi:molybdenum cofactor biosynthesis protein MoaF
MHSDIGTAHPALPQIGDIIPNHNGRCPGAIDLFDGLHTHLAGDIDVEVRFFRRECEWTEQGQTLTLEYEAFELGETLFLVDAMPVVPNGRSLTLVLDLDRMRVLLVDVTFPTPERAQTAVLARLAATGSQSAVQVRYRHASVGDNLAERFAPTRELVGKHLRYTYSATHVYDHYYLSDRYYSWFCLEGPDRQMGDFEECDYFELGPKTYLVVWREKLLPCVGILVEDHSAMLATGKICGVDAYTGAVGNTRVGANIRLIADSSGL